MGTNLIGSDHFDLSDIPGSSTWMLVSEITDNESREQKFFVVDENHEHYYLRLSEPKEYERKKIEYEHLKLMIAHRAKVPEPIYFGLGLRSQRVYLLTRWIQRNACEQRLCRLPNFQQYEKGTAAGIYLKIAHYCSVQKQRSGLWAENQIKRWQNALTAYGNGRCKINYFAKLKNMVESNLCLLADRPQCILHGNFSTGSIALDNNNSLSLLGFGNWLYGDPLYDLGNVLTGIRRVCHRFASGVLDSYFSLGIGKNDLRLINLYAAIDLVVKVNQAQRESQAAVDTALENVQIFMRDQQGCRQMWPAWYEKINSSDKKGKSSLLYVADSESP